MVVVMIYESLKTPDTLWRPYFRVLPGHFDTLIYWSPAELAELQGSAVTQKIGKDEADKTFCEQVMPIMRKSPELFPYPPGVESYEGPSGQATILAMAHTMATLVMAYGFDIEKDESKQQVDDEGFVSDDDEEDLPKGMVPLADMLNADALANNVCSVIRRRIKLPHLLDSRLDCSMARILS
jgi:SET domain-containing protein 6